MPPHAAHASVAWPARASARGPNGLALVDKRALCTSGALAASKELAGRLLVPIHVLVRGRVARSIRCAS